MFLNYFQFFESQILENLNEETEEEFEKECTHYVAIDIPGKEKYTGKMVKVKDGFGKNNPRAKGYENEVTVMLFSSSHHTSKNSFYMTDEDLKKYLKPVTQGYRSVKKYGL